MAEYGISEGLAYRHNFQQDIQNRHENAMLDMQARDRAEAKAKLVGDMFNQGKAYDTYNQKQLKDFSEKQITAMGKFMDENPDWQTSPMKYATVKNMSTQLIDNPIILESAMSKDSRDKMVEWAQKNPNSINSPQYQAQINAYDHYAKTGDSGRVPGVRTPFSFMPPEPWKDINAEFVKYGNGIKDFDVKQLDPMTHGLGAWESEIKPEELGSTISAMYLDNKEQVDFHAQKMGITPQEYLMRGIMPNINKQYQKGDWGAMIALQKANAEKSFGVSPYQRDVLNPFQKGGAGASELSPEMIEKMFGKAAPVSTIYGTGPSDKIDWRGREVRWNGRLHRVNYQGQAQPAAEGTITISRDEAIDLGIVKYWNLVDESGPSDVATAYKQFANIRQDTAGNWVVDVDVVKPFNPVSEVYKNIVDGPTPDKFQTAPGTLTQNIQLYQAKEDPNYAKGSDGQIYKFSGSGDINDMKNWTAQ
jgi:hypothetical protein